MACSAAGLRLRVSVDCSSAVSASRRADPFAGVHQGPAGVLHHRLGRHPGQGEHSAQGALLGVGRAGVVDGAVRRGRVRLAGQGPLHRPEHHPGVVGHLVAHGAPASPRPSTDCASDLVHRRSAVSAQKVCGAAATASSGAPGPAYRCPQRAFRARRASPAGTAGARRPAGCEPW